MVPFKRYKILLEAATVLLNLTFSSLFNLWMRALGGDTPEVPVSVFGCSEQDLGPAEEGRLCSGAAW